MRWRALVTAGLAAALGAACGPPETLGERACTAEGAKLTYESFGRGFFDRWCVRCHGAGEGYSSRSFTSVEAIRAARERIFVNAVGDDPPMPPGPDDPPVAEREQLADWLACGAR
ncbi:MAG: hypothetical protein IT374_11530 [Polyangiaceae bacterium]|nr:hypothetical protein [Polyangiaceae bacterium]